MQIPKKLIEKYNIPVPRYTSYPPANYFSGEFNAGDYVKTIEASNEEWPDNISLYIHIPFCTKMCYFCGCNTQVTRDKHKIRNYINALKKEILMVRKLLAVNRKVSQVHWGGGTPNSLPIGIINEIMELLETSFSFTDNPEIAIECHPALLDEQYVMQLISAGFNRISLGIQDFRQEVLDNVNRDAPTIPVKEITGWIKSHKNTAVNLDFIYGLPFQSEKTFTQTIEKAVEISPDRLVTFSYAHVPWLKQPQRILESKGLPPANEKLDMFLAAYKVMTKNNYVPIGLDHYAKENDELSIARKNRSLHRNFQGYCTRETTGQVYAFGATGISQMESAYAQNEKEVEGYIKTINKGELSTKKGYLLNQKEKVIRHIITEIMCNEYISFKETGMKFGISESEVKNIIHYDQKRFKDFLSDGLIDIDSEDVIKVKGNGHFFIRNIASKFDPGLETATNRFSKAL